MNIKECHIASKKRIGTTKDGQPVIEMLLKGGLVLITTIQDGKPKTIAAGPHIAVARWMSEKNEPGMTLEELSKSESVSLRGILSVSEEYQKIVDNWNLQPGWINSKSE